MRSSTRGDAIAQGGKDAGKGIKHQGDDLDSRRHPQGRSTTRSHDAIIGSHPRPPQLPTQSATT